MIILSIETSCDETAISLIETQEKQGKLELKVLNNAVLSQIKLHEQYGGVFPMMAKREHAKNLIPLLAKVLTDTGFLKKSATAISPQRPEKMSEVKQLLNKKEKELLESLLNEPALWNNPGIDAIAVTQGPGLEPALWVGVNCAKALSLLWNIPALPINHMEGHIVGSLFDSASNKEHRSLKSIKYPALALLISGGHTELVLINTMRDYRIIGKTRDDAVGEAFDKVARLLGLPYPGGPHISKLAAEDRSRHPHAQKTYSLPRPMLHSPDYDFSFSGIKTAVLYTLRKIQGAEQNGEQRTQETSEKMTDDSKQQIAREFEDAVTEVLITKTQKAIETFGTETLIIGGGVSANTYIRQQLKNLAEKTNLTLLLPEAEISTDNALMIALAGALILQQMPKEQLSDARSAYFKAEGNLSLS